MQPLPVALRRRSLLDDPTPRTGAVAASGPASGPAERPVHPAVAVPPVPGAARRGGRPGRVRLVLDGRPDEAPDYLAAVSALVERHGPVLERWWRASTRGRLELHWEVWGGGHQVHLQRAPGVLRCRVQRSPESAWGTGDPADRAGEDLAEALGAVAALLGRRPPLLT